MELVVVIDQMTRNVAESATMDYVGGMDTTSPSRVCPKALERRRRRGESSYTIIPKIEDAPQINEGEGDEESEELTAPFPNGPTDISLLQSFKTHKVTYIWNGHEREPLKCISHTSKLSDWEWDDNTPNHRFVTYIHQSGLQDTSISYQRANWVVIFAFVERWQPEMNTFHVSFGKMAITLDDVPTLVGIPVMGRSVNMPQRITDAQGMLVSLLGVSPQEADDKLGAWFGVAQFVGIDPIQVFQCHGFCIR